MKKTALSCWLGMVCILYGCAQNSKQQDTTTILNIEAITADTFVSQLALQTPQQPVPAPFYYLRINQHNCMYEILVNDMPVYQHYELSRLGSPIEINHLILKSGTQKVTYRLYPLGDLLVEQYEREGTITELLKTTAMEIEVIVIDHNSRKSFADEQVVLEHKSAVKADGKTFVGAGLPYYEYTFAFEAQVPYTNKGWSDGQDLTTLDPKLLEAKVLDYYRMYREIYEKKDKNKLAQINFKYELRNSISEYHNHQYNKELWEDYLRSLNRKNKTFQPLGNYKMTFFGDGRIVCLKQTSLEPRMRQKSAFWFRFIDEEGYKSRFFSDIYLYLPKGKGLEHLQIME